MTIKISQQRSTKITDEEKQAARRAINAFDELISRLKGARNADKKVVNVLKENAEAKPNDLFKIRHLLRKFQQEVRNRYSAVIIAFAGKKENMKTITEGYIHTLNVLAKDTKTRTIKEALLEAMQQLTEFEEAFLSSFEHFNSPDQIKEIINTSKKADEIITGIENIVEKQLKPHFEKNILRNKISNFHGQIVRRARIIKLLEF